MCVCVCVCVYVCMHHAMVCVWRSEDICFYSVNYSASPTFCFFFRDSLAMQPWMDLDLCQSSCCSLLITRAGSPGVFCLTWIQIILKPAKTHSSLMGAHYHERHEPHRLKRKTASGTLMMSVSLLSLCYLQGWCLHPRTTRAAFKHSWCLKPNSEERK